MYIYILLNIIDDRFDVTVWVWSNNKITDKTKHSHQFYWPACIKGKEMKVCNKLLIIISKFLLINYLLQSKRIKSSTSRCIVHLPFFRLLSLASSLSSTSLNHFSVSLKSFPFFFLIFLVVFW